MTVVTPSPDIWGQFEVVEWMEGTEPLPRGGRPPSPTPVTLEGETPLCLVNLSDQPDGDGSLGE